MSGCGDVDRYCNPRSPRAPPSPTLDVPARPPAPLLLSHTSNCTAAPALARGCVRSNWLSIEPVSPAPMIRIFFTAGAVDMVLPLCLLVPELSFPDFFRPFFFLSLSYVKSRSIKPHDCNNLTKNESISGHIVAIPWRRKIKENIHVFINLCSSDLSTGPNSFKAPIEYHACFFI